MKKFIKEIFSKENLKRTMAIMSVAQSNHVTKEDLVYLNSVLMDTKNTVTEEIQINKVA